MTVDPVLDLLRASLEEQVSVKVYVKGSCIQGVVTEIGDSAVALENREARSVLRLMSIDAVTILPHGEATPKQIGSWAKEL